jgi:hypothetical protein
VKIQTVHPKLSAAHVKEEPQEYHQLSLSSKKLKQINNAVDVENSGLEVVLLLKIHQLLE